MQLTVYDNVVVAHSRQATADLKDTRQLKIPGGVTRTLTVTCIVLLLFMHFSEHTSW